MYLSFLTLLILWVAPGSAQLCTSSREFAVDNCTACPTLRGDIEVAICEERVANTSYACVCSQIDHSVTYSFFNFPLVDESGTRCANSWEMAPHLYTAFSLVAGSVLLYPMTHVFYIVILSRIFLCKRRTCTKSNIGALFIAIWLLLTFVHLIIRVTSQGKNAGTIDADYYARAHNHLKMLFWSEHVFLDLAVALYCTNISDTLLSGEEMKGRRHCVSLTFYIPISMQCLCAIFMTTLLCVTEDLSEMTSVYISPFWQYSKFLMLLYANIVMIIVHREMHRVSQHSTSLA